VLRRAEFAAGIGADAVQIALPFWMEVADDQVVGFFADVARACALPISIYETTRAKKTLTLDQHRAVKDAAPGYLMVKANEGTVGCTPEGCQGLSEFVSVFVGETFWDSLGPAGAVGCCSAMVYWNPRMTLGLWRLLQRQAWDELEAALGPVRELHEFLGAEFAPRGFTDTAYDRMGGRACGFLQTSLCNRAPYVSPTESDVATLRDWYREHFPDMLDL
jgi:dihydrodipicolinate synthase/N-acetylneuraminate lyase